MANSIFAQDEESKLEAIENHTDEFMDCVTDIIKKGNNLKQLQAFSDIAPMGKNQDIILGQIESLKNEAKGHIESIKTLWPYDHSQQFESLIRGMETTYKIAVGSVPEPIEQFENRSEAVVAFGKTYLVSTVDLGGRYESMVFPVKNGETIMSEEVYAETYDDKESAIEGHGRICSEIEKIVNDPMSIDYVDPEQNEDVPVTESSDDRFEMCDDIEY